jgi:hypothetical protein
MNIAVAITSVIVQIAVVYFGIFHFSLTYWPMFTAILATTVALSFLSKNILPPSTVVREVHNRLLNRNTEATRDTTILDAISLIGIVTTAYLLANRYGPFPWLGIYIASCIVAVGVYILF